MSKYRQILMKYWGYPAFRERQEEIVEAVGAGKDVLGLLPTGGGKSITFQVPALASEGICLVVTPLIALMRDQVDNLNQRGIKALAIYSGMTAHEIKIAYDNAAYGNYKFLYLSPERLGTDSFLERLPLLHVNLIAVDEAHCISQWGYDFRPSYLKIAAVRKYLPDVPVLALTATATPKVVQDIMERLEFREKLIYSKSFERNNLAYVVRHVEDKQKHLLKIIEKIPGTGVVYVRNRKATKDIADFLKTQGISADYYHAGLSPETRDWKQQAWKQGKIRIIVSTNAFGMGIDKPDVRFVVHLDLPDSLEAYFQEAGRGGRDGKKAYAVLLYNHADDKAIKTRLTKSFPPRETIKQVYQDLCNYLKVAIGEGKDMVYDFNLLEFTRLFKLDQITTFSALKILEQEAYLELTDEIDNPAKIIFLVERDDLYKFQVTNEIYDVLIKLILRSYTGLFNDYVKIDEQFLANRLGITRDELYHMLQFLSKHHIINYIPAKSTPFISFKTERLSTQSLIISKENYETKKKNYSDKVSAALHYANTMQKCRSQLLLEYFGDKKARRCGMCDYCQRRNELNISQFEFDTLHDSIRDLLILKPLRAEDLIGKLNCEQQKAVKIIRWLMDERKIQYNTENCLEWTVDLFR
ncbi:MAG: RecQ family ATP-dependent DNA helicase [Bacteroidales bacterium]|nr:RecQ family ATP-dependent DNA helicase [Bacteroidales bacterium]